MLVQEPRWINPTVEFLLLIALASGFILWFAWPGIWTASESARLVSVFSSDEALFLRMLKDAVESRSFNLDFIHYGQLYFNIALVPLNLTSYFLPVSERLIMVLLRFIPAVFTIATIGLTFLLTRRYFGSLCAWLASILLAVVPLIFLKFSAISHPDIVQMFFLVASVYFCCRLGEEGRWKWIILVSVFAGLAFASKWAGIYLLPVIWMVIAVRIFMGEGRQGETNAPRFSRVTRYVLAVIGVLCVVAGIIITTPDLIAGLVPEEGEVFMPRVLQLLNSMRIVAVIIGSILILLAIPNFFWTRLAQMPRLADQLKNILKRVGLSLAVFIGAFIVTSPYSLVGLRFVQGIVFQSMHTSFGHGFKEEGGILTGLSVLTSAGLLDNFILGLAVVSLAFTVYDIYRRGWRQLSAPRSIMWVFVIIFTGYYILRVHYYAEHYLLPVIPFMVILSAQAVIQVARWIATKLTKRFSLIVVAIIVVIVIGVEVPKSIINALDYRQEVSSREDNNTMIEEGQWLSENFPASARILYDHYSYVPPSFDDASFTWGGTLEQLQSFEPDVVIVNKEISGEYSDISKAPMFHKGEEEFKRTYEYYRALEDGTTGYILVRDSGDVQIYAKAK